MPRRWKSISVALALLLAPACTTVSTDTATEAPEPTNTSARANSAIDGETFVDPQGTYSLQIAPDWQANHGTVIAEIEAWLVSTPENGFTPNVNVLTQAIPEMTLEDYLELSIEGAPTFINEFELIDEGIIDSSNGHRLATMHYASGDMQFLGVFAVSDGQAIVATLTAPSHRFDPIRDEAMPYLQTLMPLDPE